MTRLVERYLETRRQSERLCEPLAVEDFVVQSMPDASPTRWHLAHTTWFFETFVLARWLANYEPVNADFRYLFNSYYEQVGEQFPRARRGLLTRPTVAQVFAYRKAVDEMVSTMLERFEGVETDLAKVIELGIHHEQQHQELLLTDIKHAFSCNPLFPEYRDAVAERDSNRRDRAAPVDPRYQSFDGGVVEIGHDAGGFAFDNECPRHKVYLQSFEIAERLLTNGEYRKFIEDRGYQSAELWLSQGWATVRDQGWMAPLYWINRDGAWHEFTLAGLHPLRDEDPVCHVSYFEADAFARWAKCRLPTEAEWEHAASAAPVEGNFVDSQRYHPQPDRGDDPAPRQMYGEVWQWTSSSYSPYPGYKAPPGALGEYNGKFMCNQYVLRGGSCATPITHIRPTYRNFFPSDSRWQFSGIRLARDC